MTTEGDLGEHDVAGAARALRHRDGSRRGDGVEANNGLARIKERGTDG